MPISLLSAYSSNSKANKYRRRAREKRFRAVHALKRGDRAGFVRDWHTSDKFEDHRAAANAARDASLVTEVVSTAIDAASGGLSAPFTRGATVVWEFSKHAHRPDVSAGAVTPHHS